MKRNLIRSLFAGAAVLALGSAAAQAQTVQATANMEVRLEIRDGCTVNLIGGTQVDFSPRTQIFDDFLTREVDVNCTLGTGSPPGAINTYELHLPASFSNSAPITNRRMENFNQDAIFYSVRRMDTCSAPHWGDGSVAGWDPIQGTFPTAAGGDRYRFNVCIDRQDNINQGVAVNAPPLGLYADTLQIQLVY